MAATKRGSKPSGNFLPMAQFGLHEAHETELKRRRDKALVEQSLANLRRSFPLQPKQEEPSHKQRRSAREKAEAALTQKLTHLEVLLAGSSAACLRAEVPVMTADDALQDANTLFLQQFLQQLLRARGC
jgi:hypothetical protein